MLKKLGIVFVGIIAILAITGVATAADKPTKVIITKNCPEASAQKTYKGNVIIYVSGNGCVSVDSGATAIASGNATVVAHGNSTVDARDRVVLITYNRLVKCQIHGKTVTVINSSGYKPQYTGCPMAK